MERLAKKHEQVYKAIISFKQALEQYQKWQSEINPKEVEALGIDYEGIIVNLRDSMIQRFEYSIDLLWKYLKVYLEIKLGVVPEIVSPNTIVRQACNAGLISERTTEELLEMIKKLNLTSHLYHEEFAVLLCRELPQYYATMHTVIASLEV